MICWCSHSKLWHTSNIFITIILATATWLPIGSQLNVPFDSEGLGSDDGTLQPQFEPQASAATATRRPFQAISRPAITRPQFDKVLLDLRWVLHTSHHPATDHENNFESWGFNVPSQPFKASTNSEVGVGTLLALWQDLFSLTNVQMLLCSNSQRVGAYYSQCHPTRMRCRVASAWHSR